MCDDMLRKAIESSREAPPSTLPNLREPVTTVFNKLPVSEAVRPGWDLSRAWRALRERS